jgi:hypothetical protein
LSSFLSLFPTWLPLPADRGIISFLDWTLVITKLVQVPHPETPSLIPLTTPNPSLTTSPQESAMNPQSDPILCLPPSFCILPPHLSPLQGCSHIFSPPSRSTFKLDSLVSLYQPRLAMTLSSELLCPLEISRKGKMDKEKNASFGGSWDSNPSSSES